MNNLREACRYNMSMDPEVRFYADQFEGLKVQLTELRGLIKIVPPLIDEDRERRLTGDQRAAQRWGGRRRHRHLRRRGRS